jgi:hypothetical protein
LGTDGLRDEKSDERTAKESAVPRPPHIDGHFAAWSWVIACEGGSRKPM